MRGRAGVLAVLTIALGIAGCSTTEPDFSSAAPAQREPTGSSPGAQRAWAEQLCTGATELLAAQSSYEDAGSSVIPNDPTSNRRLKDLQIGAYLRALPTSIASAADQLGALRPVGDAATDEAVGMLQDQLADVQSRLPQNADPMSPSPVAGPAENREAKRLDKLVDSVPPPENTILPVANRNPMLARAIAAADSCTPMQQTSAALPPAADGTDLAACRDGDCEIEVSKEAEVRVADLTMQLNVSKTAVNIGVDYGDGGGGGAASSLSPGGSAGFGSGETNITVTVPGIKGDTAVVKFARK